MHRFHAGKPMQQVHTDALGPLTESAKHNKYILVVVGQFTKWIELKALPDQTAEAIARMYSYVLRSLFVEWAVPRMFPATKEKLSIANSSKRVNIVPPPIGLARMGRLNA